MPERDNHFPTTEELIEATAVSGNAYAWGGTARSMCLPAIEQVLYRKKPAEEVTIIDICSSFPILSRFLLEEMRQKRMNDVQRIHKGLFEGDPLTLPHANPERILSAGSSLKGAVNSDSAARLLLESAFLETVDLFAGMDIDPKIEEYYLGLLQSSKTYTAKRKVLRTNGEEGKWNVLRRVSTDMTAIDQLLAEGIDSNRIDDICRSMIAVLGEYLPTTHPVRAYSVDIEDPQKLLGEAILSFPPDYMDTMSYRDAARFSDHVRGDVLNLPFAPESADVITSVEGAPFYVSGATVHDAYSFGQNIARILRPNGTFICLPWSIADEARAVDLRAVQNGLVTGGMSTYEMVLPLDQVRARMSSRERKLSYRSPIFANKDSITLLSAQKNP